MSLKLRAESRITLVSHWQGLCGLALSACLLPVILGSFMSGPALYRHDRTASP